MPLLSTVALGCERGFRTLFSGLDFQLNAGEILKVAGANGTGKTSLLTILSGQMSNYDGKVLYQGKCLHDNRAAFARDVCFLGHKTGIKQNLTVDENIQFFTRFYPCHSSSSIKAALIRLKLNRFSDTLCCELSQGQQQRVAFARFLLSRAKLWILDEPFTALDSDGIAILEDVIRKFIQDQGAVIMTSHHEVAIPSIKILHLGSRI